MKCFGIRNFHMFINTQLSNTMSLFCWANTNNTRTVEIGVVHCWPCGSFYQKHGLVSRLKKNQQISEEVSILVTSVVQESNAGKVSHMVMLLIWRVSWPKAGAPDRDNDCNGDGEEDEEDDDGKVQCQPQGDQATVQEVVTHPLDVIVRVKPTNRLSWSRPQSQIIVLSVWFWLVNTIRSWNQQKVDCVVGSSNLKVWCSRIPSQVLQPTCLWKSGPVLEFPTVTLLPPVFTQYLN